jgi:predicted site-specific integrase-resolvase
MISKKKGRIMNLATLHTKLREDGVILFGRPLLSKYIKEGSIPFTLKSGKKIYDYDEVVGAIAKNITQRETEQQTVTSEPTNTTVAPLLIDGELPNGISLIDAKTILVKRQAISVQQKIDIVNNIYILKEDVKNDMLIASRIIRDYLLLLPEKISTELVKMRDKNEIKKFLYKEIDIVLRNLSKSETYE